jgi:hypothetical protein
MLRLPFQTALLLAPLAYALHHIEEHIIFHFRDWRLRYFPDNNQLSTETVLAILMAISLVYLLLHAIRQTRTSAAMAVLFLMSSQVHNAIYHIGGTLMFRDFSPGLITAILLYVPINLIIVRAAIQDGWLKLHQVALLFLGGGLLFWGFEFLGPPPLLATTVATWVLILASGQNRLAREQRLATGQEPDREVTVTKPHV